MKPRQPNIRRRASAASAGPTRKRLPPDERERLIAKAAVRFFAEHGFEGQTRELARRLGITQPLLYRYFPSKEALIDRVYEEVFLADWKPEWEAWLDDRSRPLEERLLRFYRDYARMVLSYEWVRLFVFAGLRGLDLNQRFLAMLRERVFARVIGELRHAKGLPPLSEVPLQPIEIEIIWWLHAGIFYIGTRQFIYGMEAPADVDQVVTMLVTAFLEGAPAKIAACLKEARDGAG
jgi:AcrR family transcriptional regulator